MVNFDIKISSKEIMAIGVVIPLVYKACRKIKLKYDIKYDKKSSEARPENEGHGVIFSDVIIDANGNKWRKEM